jgi:hypothetical protein
MFEDQYNQEMEAEVLRLEAKNRAVAAGHPEWENACIKCRCRLETLITNKCDNCS